MRIYYTAITNYIFKSPALKVSASYAGAIFAVYFLPSLLILLFMTDQLESSKLFFNLIVSGTILFLISLVVFLILYRLYIFLNGKFSLFQAIADYLKTKFKSILKSAFLSTLFLETIVLAQYLPRLLMNPDHPEFGTAFNNLLTLTVSSSFYLFAILFVIIVLFRSIRIALYHQKISWIIEGKNKTPTSKPTLFPKESMVNTSLSKIQYVYLIGGIISGILYIMYYVGRAYYEGLFSAFGIPKELIDFQLDDYIYSGAQVDTIIVSLILIAILIKLLLTFTNGHIFDKRKPKLEAQLILFYLALYSLILLYLVTLQIFRADLVIQKPYAFTILITCIAVLGFSSMLFYADKEIFNQLINNKIRRNIFIIASVITLLFSPYMTGKALGGLKGQIALSNDLPKIEIYTEKVISDNINWIAINSTVFKSNQDLYLLAKTEEYIFIKTSDNSSFINAIKSSDVLSLNIFDFKEVTNPPSQY